MGRLLEQLYPENVRTNGTTCSYSGNYVIIWYIPRSSSNLLTSDQILNFNSTHKAYYISPTIDVRKAVEIRKVLTIDIELYRALSDLDTKVEEIINPYQYKFNTYLPSDKENGESVDSELKNEIISTLSKISEVRLVNHIGIKTISGSETEGENYKTTSGQPYYYAIEVVINSSITR
jgi:hypothetical protein